MTTRVFYSDWQLQCCGTAFAVGDVVSWTAVAAEGELDDQFGAAEEPIEWLEEHHHESAQEVTTLGGTVVSIRALWQRLEQSAPESNVINRVPGDVVGADLSAADGWESDGPHPEHPVHSFIGYVVTLD